MSKSTSARDKRLARARVQRERRSQQHPLWHNRPPYKGYEDWIRVPEGAAENGLVDVELPPDTRQFLNDLVRLGPLYAGQVPMAAIYLEQQIQRGHIYIATTGAPETDGARKVPIAAFESDLRDPLYMAEVQEMFPQAQFPPHDDEAPQDAGHVLHRLHFRRLLVMDDLHVLHLPGLTPAALPA